MRESFSFRIGLNDSIMDMVINPTSDKSVIQIKREITVKSMLFMVLAVVLAFFLYSQTFLYSGGILGDLVFLAGYGWFTYLLVSPTDTRLMGYNLLRPITRWFNKAYRIISTRAVAPAAPFSALLGVKGVTEDGMIVFNNDDVGEVFELVGNASILTFKQDRETILDGVRTYYKNISPNVNLIYDSATAPQRVKVQLASKDYQLEHLGIPSKSLRRLILYQRAYLKEVIGQQFKSLHQYVVVRGRAKDDLEIYNEWLNAQVNGSGNTGVYVKSYRRLGYAETMGYLKNIFGLDVPDETEVDDEK